MEALRWNQSYPDQNRSAKIACVLLKKGSFSLVVFIYLLVMSGKRKPSGVRFCALRASGIFYCSAGQEFVSGIDKPLWDMLTASQFNFKCATRRFWSLACRCGCQKALLDFLALKENSRTPSAHCKDLLKCPDLKKLTRLRITEGEKP